MNQNKKIGNQGEALAEKYLKNLGYKIIAKNYRIGRWELDIVSQFNNRLIGLEVKTRTETTDSLNDNYLGSRQINNLKRALLSFCINKHYEIETARLDLIVITINQTTKTTKLKHYPDIF